MVVEFFEVVVDGCRWFWVVLAGCRSFLLLVTTVLCDRSLAASKGIKCGPSIKRALQTRPVDRV